MTANSRRASARRTIAWCLGGLVAGQLALAVAVEGPWADIRDPEYGHKLALIRRRVAAEPDRPLLVSMGSSLTLNGLRPEVLPSGTSDPLVFNFGLTAHGPIRQLLAMERLLRDGVRPRWITVELTPSLLALGRHELHPTQPARYTWGDVRFLYTREFCRAAFAGRWLEDRAATGYSNRFALICRWWPKWAPVHERVDFVWKNIDPAGWLACPAPHSAAESEALRVATGEGGPPTDLPIEPDSARAIGLTLARCRAEGIRAAVILMPEAGWSRQRVTAVGAERLERLTDDVRERFGVPVIDARCWCPDSEFRDAEHLLSSGAARYTERFGREVVPRLTADVQNPPEAE